MTVPHCYPSVVRNTLEISIEIRVWVKVEFIITGKRARVAVGSGTEVNCTTGTEMTSIVTSDMGVMSSNAIVEMVRGVTGDIPLINFREAVGARRSDLDVGTMRRSESRGRGKMGAGSDTRTSSRGIAMTTFVAPFATVVACAMEGGPKIL